MIPFQELSFIELKKQLENTAIITTTKKEQYYNLACSFDIETTSIIQQETKIGFMYIWMVQIGSIQVYGRKWEEFTSLLDNLVILGGLNSKKHIIIYVHNLSYEFQFMKDLFKWENVFAISERKVIKAETVNGIVFKDSYILSGYSLAKTAENLINHKIEKLTGDLDYTLIRHHETPLTKEELGYCKNDIEIVCNYINEEIETYGDITKIPLTKTGKVRNYVRDKCYYTNKNHAKSSKGKFYRYRKLMQGMKLTVPEYKIINKAFMGGFTHANALHEGKVLKDVSSFDFTSSYPSVMVSEKFPMTSPKFEKNVSRETIKKEHGWKAFIFEITINNVAPAIMQENYISESKCTKLSNPIINNGRVVSADSLTMIITEIDYLIMLQAYTWESEEIRGCLTFIKGYLPKPIIESVLTLYQDKTTLKGVEGKEVEYMGSKEKINSTYGMTVTSIIQDLHTYTNLEGWKVEPTNENEEIEKYNESYKRFLFYPWGVYITAYARRNLWTGIIDIGNDYVYSDTDSIKCLNYEKHEQYFKKYNEWIVRKMYTVCDFHNLDRSLLAPKTIKGESKMLGVWDYEGTYTRFKTLGAKRYLIEDGGKLELTVAGLSKKNGINYMIEKCKNDNTKVFEMFNDELTIPKEHTGKMTHTYIDESYTIQVTDYLGNKTNVFTNSGIHLENCSFTLSISKEYANFLSEVKKGYVFSKVEKKL